MKVFLINGDSNTGKTTICNLLINEAEKENNLIYDLCPRKTVNRVALVKLNGCICLISSAGDSSDCIRDNNKYIEQANKYLSEQKELQAKEIDILIFTARSRYQKNHIYKLANQLALKFDSDYIDFRTKKVEDKDISDVNLSKFYDIMSSIALTKKR